MVLTRGGSTGRLGGSCPPYSWCINGNMGRVREKKSINGNMGRVREKKRWRK